MTTTPFPNNPDADRVEPPTARLLLSTTEAASLLGIGRTKVYELIAVGQLHPVHIGRLCKLPLAEVIDFVERLRLAG